MKTEKLLFGAAYYDEYLPVDRIDTDMEMMKKAGMNVIRIAESTWSTWEPQEGVYDFSHLHRMLQASGEHGIRVIVGTPTYAIPTWLARKYPDIIAETHDGPGRYGHRQNMDITHPMYLKHAEIIIRRLMEEVQHYEHVIGFQLDNETHPYDTCSSYAQAKFVAYLRELFQDDIDALNDAWGLDYWSNRINTWEDFPDVRGTINASLGAEYQKFQRKLVTDFLTWQSSIVKEYARPDQFITQNFDYDWRGYSFGMHPEVNQWEAAHAVTVAGYDIYHPSAQDLTGKEISFGGAMGRSLKKDNYLILETEAQGNLGWLPYPGQLRLQAFSHIASGSNSVMYWHWHSIHNAIESYWKGVLSHNLKENETYREACQIGADFARIGDHLKNLRKDNKVALLLNHESLKALDWFAIHENLHYNEVVRWLYDAFYEMNIECDIVSEYDTDLFGQYQILVTPALYSISDSLTTALQNYVKAGGHLLSTFKTAVADKMLKIYHDDQPHNLTEVFGMTYDQFTNGIKVGLSGDLFATDSYSCHDCETSEDSAFVPESISQSKRASWDTSSWSTSLGDISALDTSSPAVQYWMELLLPTTAQVLATYDHSQWGRYAAITHNQYGKGTATYLGCYFEQEALKKVLRFVCQEAGLEVPDISYPLICKKGRNDYDKEVLYYFNYSDSLCMFTYYGPTGTVLLHGKDKKHGNLAVVGKTATVKDGDLLSLEDWDFLIISR